jgi:23S rRNA (guanine2445-N2)-methyltransferase / 23S rRNA (guanine2069-N7)-methyltransferase
MLQNDHFAALKAKDAIVDRFRDLSGRRPSIDTRAPDVRISLHLQGETATFRIDLSGESLDRRGYRETGTEAPLRETLAAAMLLRAGWPKVAAAGGPLVDPMCGSGTLPIEAALMAGDVAPGLGRRSFGLLRWRGHEPATWQQVVEEAEARRNDGLPRIPSIMGYDADRRAVRAAIANVERAGLRGAVHIERRDLRSAAPPAAGGTPGLVVVNPPYGERLGSVDELGPVYAALGHKLKRDFVGWRAAVLTGNVELGRRLGLWADTRHTLYNGAIQCSLLGFSIDAERELRGPDRAPAGAPSQMLANRLRKNLRSLRPWAEKNDVHCYRIYDADIPEYNAAIDLYERWVHVQEYEAPKSVDPAKARARLRDLVATVVDVLAVEPGDVFTKTRRRQRGRSQYSRLGEEGRFFEVREGGLRFRVNLTDYLDTGLFIDQREIRAFIRRHAARCPFLNLFGYTATATAYAIAGGATSSTTVDLSRTYLDWGRRNLELNGFDVDEHRLVRADCLQWVERARDRYGLIFLDPPTFSTSKRMRGTFDVRRDHVDLILRVVELLEDDGLLVFASGCRGFELDAKPLQGLRLEEVTRSTVPRDFSRTPNVHCCWLIRR